MNEGGEAKYTFSGFTLDVDERLLSSNGTAIQLAPKVFDTLVLLVRNQGRVLSKEKMLDEIWEGSFVEENNLAQNVSLLRRVLGETKENRFIETVPKFGYRFVAEVAVEKAADASSEIVHKVLARVYLGEERKHIIERSVERGHSVIGISGNSESPIRAVANAAVVPAQPETRYVSSGDVNIAYQVIGDGPVDLVFVMGWVSHLEYFWMEPRFASFLREISSFSRLILFDKRGTGLSDRVPINELPTLEQRMEDVHVVMDVVGSDKAVLIGVSEGGPMCSLFAATYPERTKGLVMIGTYAKRIRDDDYPWAPTTQQRSAFFEYLQREWGTAVGIEERAPSLANDAVFRDWWATYLRMGASPGAAVALTKMNAEIDVRNVLPSIRIPTLVIHRTGDLCLNVEEGRYVSSLIPGSKFVELDGDDHLPFVGDQESIIAHIREFVSDSHQGTAVDRLLATVMCVRVEPVNGNMKTSEWQQSAVLERAKVFIQRKIELFKGRRTSDDDGTIVAAFDGPARSIRCAAEIRSSIPGLGIAVSIGLHTGECDIKDGTYSGFAVGLARHIAEHARHGELIASRTVKDLVAGSGVEFTENGARSFAGVDGEWKLFTVNAG